MESAIENNVLETIYSNGDIMVEYIKETLIDLPAQDKAFYYLYSQLNLRQKLFDALHHISHIFFDSQT